MKSAILIAIGVALGAWGQSYAPASAELVTDDMTEHVAYTLGVAEGARIEALKHCACDTKRYLGAPCPPVTP